MTASQFTAFIAGWYAQHGRRLPWRETTDPYAILVSECMLQQTQVNRVIPKYQAFLQSFPSLSVLSDAPQSTVLTAWQGLGYNRRARSLHQLAKIVVERGGGLPVTHAELKALPGIGQYTASAVRVFAHNLPDVLIETNVRRVFLHHFFPKQNAVTDTAVLAKVAEYIDAEFPRQWYWALMDYGAWLGETVANANQRSKHYTKQGNFVGSLRQARGVILRALSAASCTYSELLVFTTEAGIVPDQVERALKALLKEQLIGRTGDSYHL
jgi:A/G-specific adenine glycosylase